MKQPKFKIGQDVRTVYSDLGTIVKIYSHLLEVNKQNLGGNWREWYEAQKIKPQSGPDQYWYGLDLLFPKIDEIRDSPREMLLSPEEHLVLFDGIITRKDLIRDWSVPFTYESKRDVEVKIPHLSEERIRRLRNQYRSLYLGVN